MEGAEIAWIVVVVLVAGTAQTVSGFGFALLAVPMMSLLVDPREAVVVATLLGAVSSTSQAFIDRAHANRAMVGRLALAAYLGMPFGLTLFLVFSESALRFFVGIVVALAGVMLIRGFTIHSATTRYDWLLGWFSGVLATSTSTNGPPLVFLMQAKKLDPSSFRATINAVFTLSNVGAIALFLAAGRVTGPSLIGALWAVPAMIGGLRLGYALRPRLDADRFKVLVFVLLFLSALSALVAAFLG